jgi:hypothetical protein
MVSKTHLPLHKFDAFHDIMIDLFKKDYNNLVNRIEKNIRLFPNITTIDLHLYQPGLRFVSLNYIELLENIKQFYSTLLTVE